MDFLGCEEPFKNLKSVCQNMKLKQNTKKCDVIVLNKQCCYITEDRTISWSVHV